jgi:DNA-binding transcriptional LysR family regulator
MRARIVGEARSLRQSLDAMRRGLHGLLRIGAIATALPIVHRLAVPFRTHHPGVDFTIHSRTSTEILEGLDDMKIDAGLTYLDNEPVGRVTGVLL